MTDVVERARAALEGLAKAGLVIREPCADGATYTSQGLIQHAARNAVYEVVPELIAEVEKWRAAAVYAHDDNGALQAMTAEREERR